MMECEKISQHGEISESSKTSKNQNSGRYTTYVENFQIIEIESSTRGRFTKFKDREQQKAKIQT